MNKLTTFLIGSGLLLGFLNGMPAHAQVTTPGQDALGLETTLSPEDTQELKGWIMSAQSKLRDAKDKLPFMQTSREKVSFLTDIFKVVVPESAEGSLNYPSTLLRYSLNRGLKIKTQLDTSMTELDPTKYDQEERVLEESLDIALRYSKFDLTQLAQSIGPLPYSEFGIEKADALLSINESELNINAKVEIALEILAWLHGDLSIDVYEPLFKDSIFRIYTLLKEDSVQKIKKNPYKGIKLIRETYFSVLTDLEYTNTPVGKRILDIETREKRMRPDRRIPKL